MLVCFEGIDGAGKSTLMKNVKEKLRDGAVVMTRQPGGTPLGQELRQLVLHSDHTISTNAEMLMFAADAAQLMEEVVRPAQEEGKLILCDRGWMSNVIYQTAGRSNLLAEGIYDRVFITHPPALIILLQLPLEEAQRRMNLDTPDRIESAGQGFFRRIFRAYEAVGDTWKGVRVEKFDATLPPVALADQVTALIQKIRLDRQVITLIGDHIRNAQ